MQIDRSRFLLLTSAIAAGTAACTPAESVPVSINATPDDSKADAAAPLAVTGAADASTAPVPVASATVPPTTTGPSCPDSDNMVGAPGNCGALKAPGPQCESFADTKDECGHLAKGLKPKLAQRAVDCFLSKSGTKAVCDFQLPENCAVEAVAEACIDPSLASTCDSIMTNCPRGRGGRHNAGAVTRDLCLHALSAVTSRNRSAVISCVAESCSISGCFYELK
jgi:hypothetical protein